MPNIQDWLRACRISDYFCQHADPGALFLCCSFCFHFSCHPAFHLVNQLLDFLIKVSVTGAAWSPVSCLICSSWHPIELFIWPSCSQVLPASLFMCLGLTSISMYNSVNCSIHTVDCGLLCLPNALMLWGWSLLYKPMERGTIFNLMLVVTTTTKQTSFQELSRPPF